MAVGWAGGKEIVPGSTGLKGGRRTRGCKQRMPDSRAGRWHSPGSGRGSAGVVMGMGGWVAARASDLHGRSVGGLLHWEGSLNVWVVMRRGDEMVKQRSVPELRSGLDNC